jgi:hypothetical protein
LYYQLLPTDERFLALRPWECRWLYWLNVYHGRVRRAALQSGGEKLDITSILAEESMMSDEAFDAEVARRDAEDTARQLGLPLPAIEKPPEVEEDVARFSALSPWMGPDMVRPVKKRTG